MRTDAKIGFAIGGVLLAVLTVYAIVVPKHKKTTPNTVTLVTPVPPAPQANEPAPVTPPMSAADTTAQTAKETIPPAPVAPAPSVAANTAGGLDEGIFHPAKPTEMPKSDDQKLVSPLIDQAPMSDSSTHAPKTARANKTHASEKSNSSDEPAVAADDHPYVIKPGQTLSSIASEVYGNSRFWVAIQRENKGLDANHLKVGSKIILPDITPLRPGPIAMVSDEQVAPAITSAARLPADAHTYTVKSGDSLYGISKKLFGTGRKAAALYAANKEVIGPDKSRLKLGTVLKLPQNTALALAVH